MPKTLILVDSEYDRMETSENDAWEDVKDLLRELAVDIKEGTTEANYLPWRVLVHQPGKSYEDMNIHTRITGFKVGVVFDKVGG